MKVPKATKTVEMTVQTTSNIDIWDGIPLFDYPGEEIPPEVLAVPVTPRSVSASAGRWVMPELRIPSGYTAALYKAPGDDEDLLTLDGIGDFSKVSGFESLVVKSHEPVGRGFQTKLYANTVNSFVLRVMLTAKTHAERPLLMKLRELAEKLPSPRAYLSEDGKHIEVIAPFIRHYRDMLTKLGAYPTKNNYRLNIAKALDLDALVKKSQEVKRPFPKIEIAPEVLRLNTDRIPGFTGEVDSLRNIPLAVLNVIAANVQNNKQKRTSDKTLVEKLETVGIKNLHDLLFWLPRRYIDKSNPQDISDLIEGESATILGTIEKGERVSGNTGGARFRIASAGGGYIDTVFWRQDWLLNKFKEGNEVIITGKMKTFKGTSSINGSSIDHADETILMPVVPVYKQSESKGITTAVIMSANREMLSRLGSFPLPPYLQKDGRPDYSTLMQELHFPTTPAQHQSAVDDLAYAELVLMQVRLLKERETVQKSRGLVINPDPSPRQRAVVKSLPYSLTGDQKMACRELNKTLASEEANSSLLVADVGSGKTVVVALASLRAVDAGYQAVIAAPTDILAQQIHGSITSMVEKLSEDIAVNVGLLSTGQTAKERAEVKKLVKSGEVDILVGTHSSISAAMKYKNLGLVVIDEQQKFGAEQRTALLESREDGRVPDVIMSTATPVPRSTAQVFYGDIEIIELHEKPAGRKPIETKWLETTATAILEQKLHPMWQDILTEGNKGNKTFIVAPLVTESSKVDAASVERTVKSVQSIFGKKVAYVHGTMKPAEQREVMEAFRHGDVDVLVASSIVEVGVDVPDATRVVILSAERFGAASLHQIRGRVGRNDKPSKCYLISEGKTKSAQSRLNAMVEFADGFDIAKADMATRGQGEMFGTGQSGASELIFASLATHADKIAEAVVEAKDILNSTYGAQAYNDALIRFEGEDRRML